MGSQDDRRSGDQQPDRLFGAGHRSGGESSAGQSSREIRRPVIQRGQQGQHRTLGQNATWPRDGTTIARHRPAHQSEAVGQTFPAGPEGMTSEPTEIRGDGVHRRVL